MILRGDVAARSARVDARLVGAAIAVLHLEGGASGGEREQLVAEADAKDGLLMPPGIAPEHLAQMLNCRLAPGGVAWSVGDEEAIKLLLIEVIVPRHQQQLHALGHEIADDVGLDSTVHRHDAHPLPQPANPRGRVRDEELRLLGADLRDQVHMVRVDLYHAGIIRPCRHDLAQHRAALTEVLGQSARVDPVKSRHLVLLEPI
mmetsp:Transcript_20786/g.65249  ORF Transcript_20786/g.65249 Transcript_20786/m.65249 type:complete len:203 (-) Transcript_20786:595-1203(-)